MLPAETLAAVEALFGKSFTDRAVETSPSLRGVRGRQIPLAEQAMDETFDRYQEDPEAFSAQRSATPGEIRFAIGGGPMKTFNPNSSEDQVQIPGEEDGLQVRRASSGLNLLNGQSDYATVHGGAGTASQPEIQTPELLRIRDAQRELPAAAAELELAHTKRNLERTQPLGSELPSLTGGEALDVQLKTAHEAAKQQRKDNAFLRLKTALGEVEGERKAWAMNPRDPNGRDPESYQDAIDALMRLFAAEIGDSKFLPTKPREDLGLPSGGGGPVALH